MLLGVFTKYGLGRNRGSRSSRNLRVNRVEEILDLQDCITTLVEVLNYSDENKTSINVSYETLINCRLYELEYWNLRAEKLLEDSEKRSSESE